MPIPGTTKQVRMAENVEAASVELTPADLDEIETAASKITVEGARYPERLEKLTGLQEDQLVTRALRETSNSRTTNTVVPGRDSSNGNQTKRLTAFKPGSR